VMRRSKKNSFSRKILIFASVFLFGCFLQGYGQMVQFHEEWPVHEAFVSSISGNLTYRTIPLEPPEAINEKVPKQQEIQTEWIPGYFAWEHNIKKFVWVSGVWRRSPPGHQWISGFWKSYDDGWVWFPGFWSAIPIEQIHYITLSPPDEIDDNPASPPSNNYFWVSGHWNFSHEEHRYSWVRGQWAEFDAQWILNPSHYVFRPGGYVFIPAYWDFPLQNRWVAYSSAFIDLSYSKNVAYEPSKVSSQESIIQELFAYYPNYIPLFHHHLRFHPEFWEKFCCTPAWWRWDAWWSLTRSDQWALWWWYTHPGYPQPFWINTDLSGLLPAPASQLKAQLEAALPPPSLSPQGKISRQQLLYAIRKTTGSFNPIFPANQTLINRVYKITAMEHPAKEKILIPTGRKLPIDRAAVRPLVRKPLIEVELAEESVIMPDNLRPNIPYKPKLFNHERSSSWHSYSKSRDMRRSDWVPRTVAEDYQENSNVEKHPRVSQQWRRMSPYKESRLSRPSMPVIAFDKNMAQIDWKREEDIQEKKRIDSEAEERAFEKKRVEEAVQRRLREEAAEDQKRADEKRQEDRLRSR